MEKRRVAKDSLGDTHLVDEEASSERTDNLPNKNANSDDLLVSECTRDIVVQDIAEVEGENLSSDSLDCDDCERVADFPEQ